MTANKASTDELNALHAELAKQLKDRIKTGTGTAADFREAREFLKDNKVQQVALPGTPLRDLASTLPFAGEAQAH